MNSSVIVVGGGIIGTSTAYYLSTLGVDVMLIEAKDIASGTSGACDQLIMLQSKKSGPMLSLAVESAKLYAGLEEELQADLEYRNKGGMIILETEEEYTLVNNYVKQQQQIGLDVTLLSGNEARKRQPGLSENVLGSTWCPDDAKVNSLNVCFSMMKAAEKNGAKAQLMTEVIGLIIENERVIGVETSKGKFFADAVLLTLGAWTSKLLEPHGVDVPVIPRRGQILVTEKIPPFLKANILSGAYMTAKSSNGKSGKKPDNPAGVGLVMGQTVSGNLLIGGSREFVGFNTNTTNEVTTAIANSAVRAFPELANVRIVRSFAGLRPYTPDSLPILSDVEGLPGLYISAGHEGDGIALAPISGKIMAQMICGLPTAIDCAPFSLQRFSSASVV